MYVARERANVREVFSDSKFKLPSDTNKQLKLRMSHLPN